MVRTDGERKRPKNEKASSWKEFSPEKRRKSGKSRIFAK
jgi:hypothetical protein